jgi:DNA-binding transcriptional regulator LsrR (DeoR family)
MADTESSLQIRAAWLAYVGGYTQEEIAERLGLSRVKAQRLIAAALQSGRVKVFVEGEEAQCLALEDRLKARFRLAQCTVVLDAARPGSAEAQDDFTALGSGGAQVLHRLFQKAGPSSIGVGHGRTLAAVAEHLPHLQRPDLKFVSLIGSLTRKSSANPFDVISRLAERTGGEGYFLPVPFIADTEADAEVLRAQRGVQTVLALARACELCIVGVGVLGEQGNLLHTGMLTAKEQAALERKGAVGDLLGHFLDADGQVVDHELNRRAMGVRLPEMLGRQVLAVVGGHYKVPAILAALRSGYLTGLVVNESTAERVLAHDG